ncbi:hypothetical protein ACJH6I_03650 [Mycobacterium sp. SMC-13]
MPDIQVQLTTLIRIALNKLRDARASGDDDRIEVAQRRFDYLCDKLPRTAEEKR